MRSLILRVVVAAFLGLSAILALSSCARLDPSAKSRLKLRAKLEDIEWVIVDTHDLGVGGQWVAKLKDHIAE